MVKCNIHKIQNLCVSCWCYFLFQRALCLSDTWALNVSLRCCVLPWTGPGMEDGDGAASPSISQLLRTWLLQKTVQSCVSAARLARSQAGNLFFVSLMCFLHCCSCVPWRHLEEWRCSYVCSLPGHVVEVNGQLHPLADLVLIKFPLVPIDTALQARRSHVRFPMVSLEFFIDIILLAALWPWDWLSL
jgi:hypothetical protein